MTDANQGNGGAGIEIERLVANAQDALTDDDFASEMVVPLIPLLLATVLSAGPCARSQPGRL
ncbi:MAG: hypothetical protein WB402_07315 [Sulfuricaulis sp.]|uniref:hypothetical protein n=1 Tax=Sulfuricaulis sp. TaxID=2003553 RepID=UPI003C655F25